MITEDEIKYDNKKIPVVQPGEKWVKNRLSEPKIDLKLCDRCMLCAALCPENCITLEEGKPKIDYRFCTGCLICLRECPRNAISEEGK
jgi:2-oxoacid:acceptor oxidoreductase delta subunit (pyruvate/2-ketoisovalerate family)